MAEYLTLTLFVANLVVLIIIANILVKVRGELSAGVSEVNRGFAYLTYQVGRLTTF